MEVEERLKEEYDKHGDIIVDLRGLTKKEKERIALRVFNRKYTMAALICRYSNMLGPKTFKYTSGTYSNPKQLAVNQNYKYYTYDELMNSFHYKIEKNYHV